MKGKFTMSKPENTTTHNTHNIHKNFSAVASINLGVLKKMMGADVSENDWRITVPLGGFEGTSDMQLPDHPLHDPMQPAEPKAPRRTR